MKRNFIILLTAVLCLTGVGNRMTAQELISLSKSDSCMIDAQMAYNNHQAEQAKELCRKAIEFNPRNDAAYYMIARIALMEMDNQEAENALKQAAKIDSTNYYYLATLGAVYVQNNDIMSAISLYEDIINRFPTKPDSYASLMELYIPRGMSDKALALADTLEKTIGPNEESTMTRFRIYSSRREHQKALDALISADNVTPNEMYETYIADLYAGLGKDSSALIYYSKALALDPDYVPAIYGKMEAFRRYKNYPLYLVYLKSFLGNRYTKPSIKKSHLEEVLKEPVFYREYRKEMSDCILEYAQASPGDSSVAISSAVMLSRMGEFGKAEKVLSNILQYYPDNFYVRNNMMSFLYSTENWERLKGFADTSITLFPEVSADIFQFKGIAEYNLGEYDSAIKTFLSEEKAVKKAKDTSMLLQIYSLVGDMYHQKKDDKTAFRYYDKALKIDPKNSIILNNYAWYIATAKTGVLPDKKRLAKALSMAKTAVENSSGEYHNLDTYAWVLFLNGQVEEAKKVMQQAVAYGGGDDVGILIRYSDILATLKEYDLALIYYGKALLKAAENKDQGEVDKITARIEKTKELQEEAGKTN